MVCIFLFHRDLRIEDNFPLQEALNYANKNKLELLPVFIFTPQQVGEEAPVRSLKSIACMIQCLKEIDENLKSKFNSSICLMYDDNIKALEKINKEIEIKSIFETKDYTPFAKEREELISKWCTKNKVHFEPIDYLYFTAPGEVLNKSGKIYQKFTSFYEAASRFKVSEPLGLVKGNFVSKKLSNDISNVKLSDMIKKLKLDTEEINNRMYKGGREEGLFLLNSLPKDYSKTRDIMSKETSGLSVHLHFGSLGVREVYYEVKKQLNGESEEALIRQLYWRDFYGQIICFFKELYGKDALEYENNKNMTKEQEKAYYDWCEGKTGVDLVDAAMNQLNRSGYIHNRGRLLASSYLIKDLGIPYRFGERYFAEKLLDYDFSQNFGNWSFQDGHLPFARAPFRKDTAASYQKRFDKDGQYIKEWL